MNTVEIRQAETPSGGWRVLVNGSSFMRVRTKDQALAIMKQIQNGTPLKEIKS